MSILGKMMEEKKVRVEAVKYEGTPIDVLIDGDILAYRASAATDGKYYEVYLNKFKYHKEAIAYCDTKGISHAEAIPKWEPEPESNALHNLDRSIKRVLEDISNEYKKPVAPCVFVTGKVNFRDKILPGYKSSRKGLRKPHHLSACKKRLLGEWEALEVEGYEADDLISIESYARTHTHCVVASLDKDLLQIPGKHYNWAKKEHSTVSVDEGRNSFWRQTLTGDKTDDIPGLKGIGPVKSEGMLKDLELTEASDYEYYKRVVEIYLRNIPRDGLKDEFDTVKWAETEAEYYKRVLDTLSCSAKLLHLSRDFEEEWEPPEKVSVTSDTIDLRMEQLLTKFAEESDEAKVKIIEDVFLKVLKEYPSEGITGAEKISTHIREFNKLKDARSFADGYMLGEKAKAEAAGAKAASARGILGSSISSEIWGKKVWMGAKDKATWGAEKDD